ncbi:MAG: MFS transporter [Acidimicrobiia bacterium]
MRRAASLDTTPDARLLLTTRGVRAFVDGLVSVTLSSYLVLLGLSGTQVGTIVTGTLLGSAALTLIAGFHGHRIPRRRLLSVVAAVMVATGVGFTVVTAFWLLLLVAVIGTLNPSAGDVSVFLPTEQALLPMTVSTHDRTALYARYSLVGFTAAAFGSLAAGLPDVVARHGWLSERASQRTVFAVYGLAGLVVAVLYRRLSPSIEPSQDEDRRALGPSRSIVYRLAAVFCVDAFGGGFAVQSLIALWLYRRFDLSVATAGAIFFWAGLLSGGSALVAVRIARRIGLVRTMVYTHIPANIFLMATALMPNLPLAITCLMARSALAQMDVPTRTSYVMSVVTPAERSATASVTNVPRSLVAAFAPLIAGRLLDHSTFGWPLVIGGALKLAYDVLLLAMFRKVPVRDD